MLTALKGINMKNVVYMSAEAWDEPTTLIKSWNKLLRTTEVVLVKLMTYSLQHQSSNHCLHNSIVIEPRRK